MEDEQAPTDPNSLFFAPLCVATYLLLFFWSSSILWKGNKSFKEKSWSPSGSTIDKLNVLSDGAGLTNSPHVSALEQKRKLESIKEQMFIFVCVHAVFSCAEFGSYSVKSHDTLPYIVQHLLKWGSVCTNFSFCCVLLWYLVVFVEDISRVRIVEDRQKLFRVLQIANIVGYVLLFVDSFFVAVFSDLDDFIVVQHAQGFNTTVFAALALTVSSVMVFYGAPVITLLSGTERGPDLTTTDSDRPPSARVMAALMFVTTLCLFGWGILSLIDGIYLMTNLTSYWSIAPEGLRMNSLDAPIVVLIILELLKLVPTVFALSAFLRWPWCKSRGKKVKQPIFKSGAFALDSAFESVAEEEGWDKDSNDTTFTPMNIQINNDDDDDDDQKAETVNNNAEVPPRATYRPDNPDMKPVVRDPSTQRDVPEIKASARDTKPYSLLPDPKASLPRNSSSNSDRRSPLKEPLLEKRQPSASLKSESDIFSRTISKNKPDLEPAPGSLLHSLQKPLGSSNQNQVLSDNDEMYNNSLNNSYRQEDSPNRLRLDDREDDGVFSLKENQRSAPKSSKPIVSPFASMPKIPSARQMPSFGTPPISDEKAPRPTHVTGDSAYEPPVITVTAPNPAVPDQEFLLNQLRLLQQQLQLFQQQSSQPGTRSQSMAQSRGSMRRGHARTGASSTSSGSSTESRESMVEGCDHRKVLDIYPQGDENRGCMICGMIIPLQSVRIECSCGEIIICMMCNAMHGGDDFASFMFPAAGECLMPGVVLLARVA